MNNLDPRIIDYCESLSSPEPHVLKEIYRQTFLTQINPRMLSGHLQGRLLKLITQLLRPQHILEIGTYTGYSAIAMAEGLREGSTIDTIERDEELKDTILKNFNSVGVLHKVTLHIGQALDIVPKLVVLKPYELIFIDADKENYSAYFDMVKNKLKKGSVIIADNVLWSGKVIDQYQLTNDMETKAIHEFNKRLADDETFETIVLPIRDGISIAIKK